MIEEQTVRLISRSEFAKLANVSAAAVTNACNSSLKPATNGKRIDLDHPCAQLYINKKIYQHTESAEIGLDPYYSLAVDYYHQTGNKTCRSIQKKFHIGHQRAKSIVDTMKANNILYFDENSLKSDKKGSFPGEDLNLSRRKAAAMAKKNSESTFFIEGDENIEIYLDMTLRELVDKFGTATSFSDWLAATKRIEDVYEKRLKNAKTKGELISRKLVEVGVIDVFNSAHLRLMADGAKTLANGVISKHLTGVEVPEIEAFITDIVGSFIKPVKSKIERSLRNVAA